MKVLIIVPAYNEALNIEKTIKDIKENTNYSGKCSGIWLCNYKWLFKRQHKRSMWKK